MLRLHFVFSGQLGVGQSFRNPELVTSGPGWDGFQPGFLNLKLNQQLKVCLVDNPQAGGFLGVTVELLGPKEIKEDEPHIYFY